MTKKNSTFSTADDVRSWAQGQGITTGYGTRGRLAKSLIADFDAAHPEAPYAKAQPHTVTLTVRLLNKKDKEYPVTKQVTPAEVKRLAGCEGAKGSLSGEMRAKAQAALQAELRAAKA